MYNKYILNVRGLNFLNNGALESRTDITDTDVKIIVNCELSLSK